MASNPSGYFPSWVHWRHIARAAPARAVFQRIKRHHPMMDRVSLSCGRSLSGSLVCCLSRSIRPVVRGRLLMRSAIPLPRSRQMEPTKDAGDYSSAASPRIMARDCWTTLAVRRFGDLQDSTNDNESLNACCCGISAS